MTVETDVETDEQRDLADSKDSSERITQEGAQSQRVVFEDIHPIDCIVSYYFLPCYSDRATLRL